MIKRNKIKIRINGKKLVLSSTDTLDDLVNKLNIPIKKVAIELNRKIIDKKKIKKIKLKKMILLK